jgi:two-component system OmpR family sensor kinase
MNDLAMPEFAGKDRAMTELPTNVPANDHPDAGARKRGKPSRAFRRRLTMALAVLAAVAALQGALALWAVWVAERHVLRGRVAAEIQHEFFTLAAKKQQLRKWVAERQFGVSADDGPRDTLLAEMRATLARLDFLAAHAVALDATPAARLRQARRSDSLKVLEANLMQLASGLETPWRLPDGVDPASAWVAAERLFDEAEGRDMRALLADSMEREDEAVREKRADTDRTLGLMRLLWIGSTSALILAALLLAWHFARALNRPLLSLSTGAQALRDGRLAHRIAIDGADEFAEVARSMNAMADELAEQSWRRSFEQFGGVS